MGGVSGGGSDFDQSNRKLTLQLTSFGDRFRDNIQQQGAGPFEQKSLLWHQGSCAIVGGTGDPTTDTRCGHLRDVTIGDVAWHKHSLES